MEGRTIGKRKPKSDPGNPGATETPREAGSAGPEKAPSKSAVMLTHPDRLYWRDAGVTKEGLANHYRRVWRFMAPHVESRPLALLRCPRGAAAKCFFQKHAWKGIRRDILIATDPLDEEVDNSLLAIDSLDGLVGLVQAAALEIHAWQARLADLERPDQLVMDLDPGDGVSWSAVLDAAREVRARLEAAGLAAFVRTTGGKGLHVVAPLQPKAGWEEVKGFARDLAAAMVGDRPRHFVAKASKTARRGRIYVDYLRNGRGAIAIVPYSTRARPGATVAMPLGWDELDPSIDSGHFTVANAAARLENLASDPWEDFRRAARPLENRAATRTSR